MGKFKNHKWTKIVLNKYLIVGLAFAVWMIFFDKDSYLMHKNLNKDIYELNKDKNYYENQINIESLRLYNLNHNPNEIIKIAREKYLMKKDSEDIYLIVEQKDTLP